MKHDKYTKQYPLIRTMFIFCTVLLVVAFISGCSPRDPTTGQSPSAGDTQATTPPNAQTAPPPISNPPVDPTSPSINPPGTPTDAPLKEFSMTAENFRFSPSTITVDQGDRVRLKVTSLDTPHGIIIQGYDLSKELPVGQEVTIDFIADKKGTFAFRCNVPCGPGHREMTGTITVK